MNTKLTPIEGSEYDIELEWSTCYCRVYDKDRGNMSYVGSCLFLVNGDVAWVRSLSSPLVLDALIDSIDDVYDKLGVRFMEGTMNPAMYRYLSGKAKGRALITVKPSVKSSGRDLPWVRMERLPKE